MQKNPAHQGSYESDEEPGCPLLNFCIFEALVCQFFSVSYYFLCQALWWRVCLGPIFAKHKMWELNEKIFGKKKQQQKKSSYYWISIKIKRLKLFQTISFMLNHLSRLQKEFKIDSQKLFK